MCLVFDVDESLRDGTTLASNQSPAEIALGRKVIVDSRRPDVHAFGQVFDAERIEAAGSSNSCATSRMAAMVYALVMVKPIDGSIDSQRLAR